MLGTAPLGESEGHTQAGHGGQKGLQLLMQPLPPTAFAY